MSQELFDSLAAASETNIENSIATVFGQALLDVGYVLYWHASDGLQTPDGWYQGYSVNQATYVADPTVAARLQAALGLFTIAERPSALPRTPTRPTTGGLVGAPDQLSSPVAAIKVDPVLTGPGYEIGTRRRVRNRVMTIETVCRDLTEQTRLTDLFPQILDDESTVEVLDHDGGTLAVVGSVDVLKGSIDSQLVPFGADAFTYTVTFHAVLEFVA